jgi:hypothetical protein
MQELPKKHNRPDTPLASTPDPKYVAFQERLSKVRKRAQEDSKEIRKKRESDYMKTAFEDAQNYDLVKKQKIKY